MSPPRNDSAPPPEGVLSRIDEFPGVSSAATDRSSGEITVRVDGSRVDEFAAAILHSLLLAENPDQELPAPRIELVSGPEAVVGRRARFESLDVAQPSPGWIAARVELEWKGGTYTGGAEGEYNPAGELRVCATAALRAVERIAGESVTFVLVGVKEIHVFDHDLVAVLIHAPGLPDPRLIGTAIISENRRRAAAIAALNATNRVFGRFLGE